MPTWTNNSDRPAEAAEAAGPASADIGIPAVVHRTRSWRERSLWRFLMAAVVLAVLHLPFLFVDFKSEEPAGLEEKPLPEVVSLPSPSQRGQGAAAAMPDLYGWLRLANPAQWYFPDAQAGFSAANRPVGRPGDPAFPEYSQPSYALGRFLFGAKQLTVPPANVSATAPGLWWRVPGRPLPPEATPSGEAVAVALPVPAYRIDWRLADGRPLAEPPLLDAVGLEVWRNPETRRQLEEGAGDGVTCLEVIFTGPARFPGTEEGAAARNRLRLPRIVLRQSCGVPALDAAAQRALRKSLRNAYVGDRPPDAGSITLSISW